MFNVQESGMTIFCDQILPSTVAAGINPKVTGWANVGTVDEYVTMEELYRVKGKPPAGKVR